MSTRPGEEPQTPFIDSGKARVLAGLIIVAGSAILAYYHRADLFPAPEQAEIANPALAACISERTGHVDKMLADGVVKPEQADQFRTRAIQFCEQQNPG